MGRKFWRTPLNPGPPAAPAGEIHQEHLACEHAVAPVWDENGDPVSLICMFGEERREFTRFEDVPEGEGGEGD